MMKKLLILMLACVVLVGCEEDVAIVTPEDVQTEVVETPEEKVIAVGEAEEKAVVVDVAEESKVMNNEEYFNFMENSSQAFYEESLLLNDYYVKVQNDPSLILNGEYAEKLKGFENAFKLLLEHHKTMLNEDEVPKDFVDIHNTNLYAIDFMVMSISKNIESIESGEPELMKEAISYQEASREAIIEATSLIEDLVKTGFN